MLQVGISNLRSARTGIGKRIFCKRRCIIIFSCRAGKSRKSFFGS
jgi:hypothetical protein